MHKWLADRTFSYQSFSALDQLVAAKQEKNLRISLCFPTLNEEKTIGKSVVLMKSELMERLPLLDEIAVIDSGSTDNTCAIAAEFGADIYLAEDCLPGEGAFRGKGENLWKALYLLDGDIIVYVDSDISNVHPRFVYGLLGPLLMDSEIKFVKAFYERPVMHSGVLKPSGGGRVTEILVRPLFSQFFPDLAGIIQPLSGEYAGYREVLEQIPFPIGYGVETGMLIDIYQKWGLEVMAQTDLAQRVHRNQPTTALGRMAFGIMQTFWDRLHKYKGQGPLEPESLLFRTIAKSEEGAYALEEGMVQEKERRPMIEVAEYRQKHGRKMPENGPDSSSSEES